MELNTSTSIMSFKHAGGHSKVREWMGEVHVVLLLRPVAFPRLYLQDGKS